MDNIDVYLKNKTRKKDTEIQSCYLIKGISNASENAHLLYILFCHAFAACCTTS